MTARTVGIAVVLLWALSWAPAESRAADRAGERRVGAGVRGAAPAAGPDLPAAETARTPDASEAPAPVPAYRSSTGEEERSLVWDGLRMTLSLAAVLAVLGMGAKLLRRWPGLARGGLASGGLQVLGRVALGAKEAVCLVQVGREILVVGVTPGAVSLLHRVDEAETRRIPAAGAVGPGPGGVEPGRAAGRGLRELVERLRDVQASWGIPGAGAGRDR
jgi:flagellar protein FliO/FliZ